MATRIDVRGETPTSLHPLATSRPRRARPCGRDPSKPAMLTRAMRRFPRTDWAGVVFPWPVFPRGSTLKLTWGGRAASRSWATAFDSGDMSMLDAVDFAVAVFDKTAEFYAYTREVRIAQGRGVSTLEDWYALINCIAAYVHKIALEQVHERFPAVDLSPFADDTYLSQFVLPAMDTQWTGIADSPGGPPVRRPYDEARYLDRYVPDPASLPARPFFKLNLDNEPDFKPAVLWLDAYGKERRPPITGDAASTPPRPHSQSIPLSTQPSPESTDSSTGTDSTAGTATISVSSFASTLNGSPTSEKREDEQE